MTSTTASAKNGSSKAGSAQRKWVAPSLTRLSAGLAENGFSQNTPDGQFSHS
jgi:hypothetical protein